MIYSSCKETIYKPRRRWIVLAEWTTQHFTHFLVLIHQDCSQKRPCKNHSRYISGATIYQCRLSEIPLVHSVILIPQRWHQPGGTRFDAGPVRSSCRFLAKTHQPRFETPLRFKCVGDDRNAVFTTFYSVDGHSRRTKLSGALTDLQVDLVTPKFFNSPYFELRC